MKRLAEIELEAWQQILAARSGRKRDFDDPCLKSFEHFFRAHAPAPNYVYGAHTLALMRELQKTTEMLEQKKSRHVAVCIVFRHGKSDQVSRRYPVWHLLRNPHHEVILTGYGKELVNDFSYEARRCFSDAGLKYDLQLQADRAAISAWKITGHNGGLYCAGIGGAIVGRGANVLIIDDPIKGREQAESQVIRDKTWNTFTNDLLTRLTPTAAVFIVATRYHEDDVIGRIINRNNPTHRDYDRNFPVFEILKFPAQKTDGNWLFPERYPPRWYENIRSALGSYAWSGLGQQDPQPRRGRLLRADLVVATDSAPDWTKGKIFYRGWDVASTEKELVKDDPDYTVGTLACVDVSTGAPKIYVENVMRGRWSAPERNKRILEAAERDAAVPGRQTIVNVESVAGYKDTYEIVRAALQGKSVVRKIVPGKDKTSRASMALEAAIEAGNVFVARAGWNAEWLREFSGFPKGAKHDDQVDSLVVAVYNEIAGKGRMFFAR